MNLKKLLIVVLFVVTLVYVGAQRYSVKAGNGPDGKYRLILVDMSKGTITHLWGK